MVSYVKKQITAKVKTSGNLLHLQLLDHLIIANKANTPLLIIGPYKRHLLFFKLECAAKKTFLNSSGSLFLIVMSQLIYISRLFYTTIF